MSFLFPSSVRKLKTCGHPLYLSRQCAPQLSESPTLSLLFIIVCIDKRHDNSVQLAGKVVLAHPYIIEKDAIVTAIVQYQAFH